MNSAQKLNLDIQVEIPRDSILIKKIELENLRKQSLSGVYWNMANLETRINKKQHWIKENILYRPQFKKVLDSKNGGFVHYPQGKGERWSFQASKMAEFLDKNFNAIFKNK